MSDKSYRDDLVEQIRYTGKELIRRADDIVGPNLDLISELTIMCILGRPGEPPTMNISIDLVNKEAVDYMVNSQQKGNK